MAHKVVTDWSAVQVSKANLYRLRQARYALSYETPPFTVLVGEAISYYLTYLEEKSRLPNPPPKIKN